MGRIRQFIRMGPLAIAIGASIASAQGTTISGRVTSQAGAPVAGAMVVVQGLGVGVQSDESGRYTFSVVPPSAGQGATLTARVLGYLPVSAQVTLTSGQTVMQNFVLAPNPLHLGEIVVTGAGTST